MSNKELIKRLRMDIEEADVKIQLHESQGYNSEAGFWRGVRCQAESTIMKIKGIKQDW